MSKSDETPLMQQWREAKARHPDALIFFRVGDFYEMFHEDAETGAKLLGLTLTTRNNGGARDVPLAGVPVRAKDEYVQRLVRMGHRVAICEQVEDPAEAKGLVRREVVETITPGAALSDALLVANRNNFLVALAGAWDEAGAGSIALAAADASTGELLATRVAAGSLETELARLEPAELLLPQSWQGRAIPGADGASLTFRPDWLFDEELAAEELRRRFRVHSLDGFGIQGDEGALVALDPEPVEGVHAEAPAQLLRCQLLVEEPVGPERQARAVGAGDGSSLPRLGEEQFRGLEAGELGLQRSRGDAGGQEFAGGRVGSGESDRPGAGLVPRACQCDEEVVAVGDEERVRERGARCDRLDDLAPHESLRLGGVLDLLADGDAMAHADQTLDVLVLGAHRHAREGHVPGAAVVSRGQGEPQQFGARLRVLVEHFVEIADAEEDQRVRMARLGLTPLLHERGFVRLRHDARAGG